MRSTRLVIGLGLAAMGLAVPFAVGQQPQGEPFSTAIRKLKDGLFVIPGYDGAVTGGNVAVRVTTEGVIIVDDKFPPASNEIVPKVRSVTSQPIRYVLQTHSHGDHAGGHPEFITIAEIIGHRNARANMVRNKQAAPPRLTFSDQAGVFLGGVEVQTLHLGRGHTDGDAVIYFPDLATVHTGDLVVWGKRTDGTVLTPFVDRRNGGSLVQWITTLENLLKLEFDAAIPGHGPVLRKDDVRSFRDRLVTLRQRIADVVRSGVTKEEFGAKLKTDDLGWPFPQERLDELWDELGARR